MGLSKRITLDNGATTNYHRIAKIEHIIGQETSITVQSYTSQAKRKEEKKVDEENPTPVTFIHDHWFPREYDDTLTIEKAYEWLKEQPEFEGAKDAIEGD